MEMMEILGLVAGACTSAASVPQIVKTVKEKQAENVSPLMFILLLAGNALWTYYGFAKSDVPIIATNIFALAMDVTMLFLKWKYDGQRER